MSQETRIKKSAAYFSYKEVIQNSVRSFANNEEESKGRLVISEEIAKEADDFFYSLVNDNKHLLSEDTSSK